MTYDNTWVPVVYNVLTAAQLQQMVDNMTYVHSIPPSHLLIQTIAGDGIITSFNFTSIPATYKNLEIIYYGRSAVAAVTDENLRMQFNADTGNNYYSFRDMHHNSAETRDETTAAAYMLVSNIPGANAVAGQTVAGRISIPRYADTTFHKNAIGEAGEVWKQASDGYNYHQFVGYWKSTAAITSVKLYATTGPIMTGSYASLYGVMG
jgi:hypothetical protein